MTSVLSELPADATRQLYERHSSRIFGFCLSRLGSREEAEDALQTTFLNAQRGLGRGVVPEYELAWLFKIAQNVCHTRHQSARRRGRVEGTQDVAALQDIVASPDRSAPVSLGELTRALGAIPARQRRALLLREFQGYSYDEIAGDLGVSVAAVETLLFRARRGVARELERAGAMPRRRSRGAAASIFDLIRPLFGGAAPPAKLALAGAAMATAAAVAFVPSHDHGAVPAAPSFDAPAAAAPTRGTSPSRHAVVHRTVEPAAAGPASSALLPPEGAAPAPDASPAPSRPAGGAANPSSPARPLPSVALPPQPVTEVALPRLGTPDVLLPAVTLPTVALPAPTPPVVTVPKVTAPAVQLP